VSHTTSPISSLCELGCVLSLLESVTLERLGDLGVALAVGLTAHRQIHAHLGALADEVVVESLHELGVVDLAVADLMLGNELQRTGVLLCLLELILAYLAHRALLGCLVALVDITTYGADPFLCHNTISFIGFVYFRQRRYDIMR